eukprot:TRINITY_DN100_c2_g6_i1.p1 TRINITY_DN100_c2_g6~~TRINITY_DN100_c2_g6_i1.p1  ORF type:complete len:459 (+),score=8.90 TRINITY_DN100_c2_g6_i1:124-1377(+)
MPEIYYQKIELPNSSLKSSRDQPFYPKYIYSEKILKCIMNLYFFTLLLTILAFCAKYAKATWNKPTLFSPIDDYIEYGDAFTDQTSKAVHVLAWMPQYLYYMRFKNDVLKQTTKLPVYIYSALEMRITGEGDGKHVYIASQDGYSNIVFMESDTGGEFWSVPLKINRETLDCRMGSINYIHETRRLYMVYTCLNPSGLFFVSKPAGSSVFSLERLVCEALSPLSSDTAYTKEGDKIIIHAFMVDLGVISHRKSANNGVTWSYKNDLSHLEVMLVRAVANTKMTNGLFVFFNVGNYDVRMRYSMDNAETFEPAVTFEGKLDKQYARICGTKDKKILAVVSPGSDYMHWTGWESREIKSECFDTPFNEKATGMACDSTLPIKVTMMGRVKSGAHGVADGHYILSTNWPYFGLVDILHLI